MKGVSSHALNDQIPGRAFGWQNGYAALSVSPKHVARVQEYVRRQMEHHRCGEVHEDWEQAGP
jgi:REP element-mobilizing transposase RayT